MIGYNYYFSLDKNSIAATGDGKAEYFRISSYRIKTVNGAETGSKENVSWTSSIVGTGISIDTPSGSGGENVQIKVDVGVNTTSSPRSGRIDFTQQNSSKTVSIAIIQEGSDLNLQGDYNGMVATIGTSNFIAGVDSYGGYYKLQTTSPFTIKNQSNEAFEISLLRFDFTVSNGQVSGISNVDGSGDLPIDDETFKLSLGLKAINGQIGFVFNMLNYDIPNIAMSLTRK